MIASVALLVGCTVSTGLRPDFEFACEIEKADCPDGTECSADGHCRATSRPFDGGAADGSAADASLADGGAARDGGDARPSRPRVHISPQQPLTADGLEVVVDEPSSSPGNATVSYTYQWFKAGRELTELTGASIPPNTIARGEQWRVRVTPAAGAVVGESAEDTVVVRNAPPTTTSLNVYPIRIGMDDPVRAVWIGSDREGDQVRSILEYYKVEADGGLQPLSASVAPTPRQLGLTVGSRLLVRTRPFDQLEYGPPVASRVITIEPDPRWTQVLPGGDFYTIGGHVYFDKPRNRLLVFDAPFADASFENAQLFELSLAPSTFKRWSWLRVANAPNVRDTHLSMDLTNHRLMLAGVGLNLGASAIGTVELHLSHGAEGWRSVDAGPPPPRRYFGSFVHDAEHDRFLLFGGLSSLAPLQMASETWALTTAGGSSTWRLLSPPGRANGVALALAVYDPVNARIVSLGGFTSSDGGLSAERSVWTLAANPGGEEWTALNPGGTAPPAREAAAAAYHPTTQRLIYLGGCALGAGREHGCVLPLRDGYALNLRAGSESWEQLAFGAGGPAGAIVSMAWVEPLAAFAVLALGINASSADRHAELWLLSPSAVGEWTWSPLWRVADLPRPRADANLLCEGGPLLLNGRASSDQTILSDAWRLVNDDWVPLTQRGTLPTPRTGAALAKAGADARFYVTGGECLSDGGLGGRSTCGNAVYEATLSGDLTWRRLAGDASIGPTARIGIAAASSGVDLKWIGRNAADGGGEAWEATADDGWLWADATASQPPPTENATLVHDEALRRFFLFGGLTPTSPDVWTIGSDSWTQQTWQDGARTDGGPALRKHVAIGRLDPGRFLTFGGVGASGENTKDIWRLSCSGDPVACAWESLAYAELASGPPASSVRAGCFRSGGRDEASILYVIGEGRDLWTFGPLR